MAAGGQGGTITVGSNGDLDGQSFGLGAASKDQRANKDALLKMTRNKRQPAPGAGPSKTPGGQQIK